TSRDNWIFIGKPCASPGSANFRDGKFLRLRATVLPGRGVPRRAVERAAGADVVLIERHNHLGGLSTGGLVIWIDRMTDWSGRRVIEGIAAELLDRLPRDAVAGP